MSMSGYTKLFNSILASTIWRSSDKTRIVWITLLAMADKDGVCEGSIPGLADLSRVSIEDCEIALAELAAPDPYSRTSDHEGRRIEYVDGVGWQLLNHGKYRAKMSEDERREYNRMKQAEWRAKNKEAVKNGQPVSNDVNDSQSLSAMSAHTEADTEADTEAKARKEKKKKAPPPTFDELVTEQLNNPDYAGIDVLEESAKAANWIAKKPCRKFTKRFFTAWLDKIEPEIEIPSQILNGKVSANVPQTYHGRKIGEMW